MNSDSIPHWLNPASWLPMARQARRQDVLDSLHAAQPGVAEFATLLSPAAHDSLELMAQRAQMITQRFFGRTISLYAPLYLSDYCTSGCVYCGFAGDRQHPRRRLSWDEMAHEMDALGHMGFEEILLLTGERAPQADFEYLREAATMAADRFHLVTVESFAMTSVEYRELIQAGCTGITLYQETYDPGIYQQMHRWGPKRDFIYRLNTPARALQSGLRAIGLGVLLGLANPIADALALFQHLTYLRKTYWQANFAISFPRIRPQTGGFTPPYPVPDHFLAQLIFACRICLPEISLVLSTRENSIFRDGMAGIGINKMSVASRTTVGGYEADCPRDDGQFQVADTRTVNDFCTMLRRKKLEPVFKNWESVYRETTV